MKSNGNYDWKFSTVGGVTRVDISSGADIAHLDELDQKLWTVLSCPVKGLEMDQKSLASLDVDKDGRIHVNDVLASSKWLVKVLKDPEILVGGGDVIPLSAFNQEDEEGKALFESAKQILANLGLEKEEISLAEVSDSLAIFSKTRFNGDGIITPASAEDEILKRTIEDCIKVTGSVTDRSGEQGIDSGMLEKFYAAIQDYSDWKSAGDSLKDSIFPYGDDTEAALAACEALKEKIDDYFLRCKLAAFNADDASPLDVNAERIGAIGEKNLSSCMAEISEYPLAKVSSDMALSLSAGINPVWQDAVATLKSLVLDVDYPGMESLDEASWKAVQNKLAAYCDWKASKKGEIVESLGYDRVKELLALNGKEALLALISQDQAQKNAADSIESVEKVLFLKRDFMTFLRNFVTFTDFYNPAKTAIFQAGTLYIDQRSCNLCIKVNDLDKQGAMAPQSGMFLIFCDCVSKQRPEKLSIVAVLTDGDVNDVKVGKNAIFYDRNGLDWDAVVTKIVDNPISIRQAFWSPYRKMGDFIENTVSKFASTQESKMDSNAAESISNAGAKVTAAPAEGAPAADAKKPQPFDMTKFLGLFAVIGMALGTICGFLLSLITGFLKLQWWQMVLVLVGVVLLISTPSMILAWLKLRKRNLSPVLNANGWAMNAKALVNVTFGSTLTAIVRLPKTAGRDPFAKRKPFWRKAVDLLLVLAILGALAFWLYTRYCQ